MMIYLEKPRAKAFPFFFLKLIYRKSSKCHSLLSTKPTFMLARCQIRITCDYFVIEVKENTIFEI